MTYFKFNNCHTEMYHPVRKAYVKCTFSVAGWNNISIYVNGNDLLTEVGNILGLESEDEILTSFNKHRGELLVAVERGIYGGWNMDRDFVGVFLQVIDRMIVSAFGDKIPESREQNIREQKNIDKQHRLAGHVQLEFE